MGKWAKGADGGQRLVADVVRRYKSLVDIERGFWVLKSDIEIAPVYHRLPERIKAHTSICFMALIVYRVMRQRLKAAGSGLPPKPPCQNCAAFSGTRRVLTTAPPSSR